MKYLLTFLLAFALNSWAQGICAGISTTGPATMTEATLHAGLMTTAQMDALGAAL